MRYSRQTNLKEVGMSGQKKLQKTKVAIIGIGALGTHSAELIVRAGFGSVTLIDHDIIDITNLQRQTLFTEEDIGKLKAETAAKKLQKINSEVKIYAKNIHIDEKSIYKIDAKIILDCTDNLKTRFIINQYCRKKNIPWIHAAAASTIGNVYTITKDMPCLECVFPEAKHGEKCEDLGILNTLPPIVSSIQVTEAIKLVLGKQTTKKFIHIDIWTNNIEKIKPKRNPGCNTCNGIFNLFDNKKNAAQGFFTINRCKTKAKFSVKLNKNTKLNLAKIASNFGVIVETPILLVLKIGKEEIIVHDYGEILFKSLEDEEKIENIAKKIYGVGI